MSHGCDSATRLVRALTTMARGADLAIAIEHVRSIPWASALFVGEQVRLMLCGPDTRAFLEWSRSLPEADFALPGYLVIDFVVVSQTTAADVGRCEVLALLIEEEN